MVKLPPILYCRWFLFVFVFVFWSGLADFHWHLLFCVFFMGSLWLQDEICRSIAESGGIDAVLRCIDDSGEQGNQTVARVCCSLLSKVLTKSLLWPSLNMKTRTYTCLLSTPVLSIWVFTIELPILTLYQLCGMFWRNSQSAYEFLHCRRNAWAHWLVVRCSIWYWYLSVLDGMVHPSTVCNLRAIVLVSSDVNTSPIFCTNYLPPTMLTLNTSETGNWVKPAANLKSAAFLFTSYLYICLN